MAESMDWELAITLVEGGVLKPPKPPKMEALEKWLSAKKWELAIDHAHGTGTATATITATVIDELITFQGFDSTMAMATAKAIADALRSMPRQASFVDADAPTPKPKRTEADLPEGDQTSFTADVVTAVKDGFDRLATVTPQSVADRIDDILSTPVENDRDAAGYDLDPAPNLAADWRFLFIVDPADIKSWQDNAPADDEGIAYVEFDEGTGANDRGWYLDSMYDYDHKLGTITHRELKQIVWSRDHPAGVVQPDPPKSRAKIKRDAILAAPNITG